MLVYDIDATFEGLQTGDRFCGHWRIASVPTAEDLREIREFLEQRIRRAYEDPSLPLDGPDWEYECIVSDDDDEVELWCKYIVDVEEGPSSGFDWKTG